MRRIHSIQVSASPYPSPDQNPPPSHLRHPPPPPTILVLVKRINFSPLPNRKQCDQKKLPNVSKSCPKLISVEKLKILTPFQKLPKSVGDLGKLIVAKG